MITLILEFKKIENDDETKYRIFFFNSKTKEGENDDMFESVYIKFIWHIQKSLGKGSGWVIDLVIDNIINIWK